MAFKDRQEAAELLARRLEHFRGQNVLVLGIPRGGVVMGAVLARRLEAELDVVLVRKLGAPQNPEFAIGAVTESGSYLLNDEDYVAAFGAEYLKRQAAETAKLLRDRRAFYTPHHAPRDPKGRIAIVADDGIATGATMVAALNSLRQAKAARIIVAAAVAPMRTAENLQLRADEVVCLETPEDFRSVSQFFEDFGEVTDEEVIDLLREGKRRKAG